MGRVERKERAIVVTNLRCKKGLDRALQNAIRYNIRQDIQNACHDIVVECMPTTSDPRDDRLVVRADCTSPKTKDKFENIVSRYAVAIQSALGVK
jgi:hypothetical protein